MKQCEDFLEAGPQETPKQPRQQNTKKKQQTKNGLRPPDLIMTDGA